MKIAKPGLLASASSGVMAAAIVAVGAQTPSLDSTQWRGSTRDGAASAFNAPARWPEQLTRRWQVTVGEGYGTPLVVGNRWDKSATRAQCPH